MVVVREGILDCRMRKISSVVGRACSFSLFRSWRAQRNRESGGMFWTSGSFVGGSALAAVAGFAWMDAETRRTSSMLVHKAYFWSSLLDLGSGRTEKDSACDSLREESEAERLRRSERWWDLRDVRARWVCVTSGRRNRCESVRVREWNAEPGCEGGCART